MVPLPDFSGYWFAHRLDLLHKAFITSRDALDALVKEQEEALAAYEREVAGGMEPIEEREPDGNLLWSQDKVLELGIDDAKEALQTVHKATVISAYHVWEDAVRRYTGKMHAKHPGLVKALEDHDVSAHPDLDWIVLLVNLLKHGNPDRGRTLHGLRPDLFRRNFNPERQHIDWYGAVVLSLDTVELVIKRLGQSGPVTRLGSHTGRL